MNYPLIKKFLSGLSLKYQVGDYEADTYVVTLKDLESELAKGVEVFGTHDITERKHHNYNGEKTSVDKYTALLIGHQPIENQEPVSKEELISFLDQINGKCKDNLLDQTLTNLSERIKKNGVR